VKWQQQQIDLKKCNYLQLMYKIESDFVPGRPGTEEFVPGHLLLPLSRDKGTPGQGKCPGTKGQRDVPSRFVPGRPAGRPVPWKPYLKPAMEVSSRFPVNRQNHW
jgi:hypothetical protein